MDKQMELSLLGDVTGRIKDLPAHLVSICETKADAYRLCMNSARVKRCDRVTAELLKISPGYLSQILNPRSESPKYMPPNVEIKLMFLCENRAPIQWSDMALKGELYCQQNGKSEFIEELLELALTT